MTRPASAKAKAPRKESYHHGDLRRALMDATLRLVEEHGPQGFTLRAAARAAGVTPGATYHHFEDKDALLVAVAEEGFELFRADLEAAAKRPAASPRERARHVGTAYVLFAVKHPTRFRVMVGLGVQDRLSSGAALGEAKATFRLVRDVLIQGLRERPEDEVSDREVFGWWATVHGLAFLAIDGHLGRTGTQSARAEIFVEEVLAALEGRARPRAGT